MNTEVSMAAVSFIQTYFYNKEMVHLSSVMADMQQSIEPVMTKFVQTFSKKENK